MPTQNIYALTDTWNAGGTTFTAIKMNVTDTASASGSLLLDLQVGGTSVARITKTGTLNLLGGTANEIAAAGTIRSNALFWVNNDGGYITFGTSSDTILTRDAADTLAQRRGTNAQAFRIYNTFTDASNYERAVFGYSSNRVRIGHEFAGTGVARSLDLMGQDIQFRSSNAGTAWWYISSSGHILANTDNTYDIGAPSATRPRAIYSGLSVSAGTTLNYGNNRGLVSTNFGTSIGSPADGVVLMTDNAQTSFGRLQFGGTTSSFPSLKRNAAALETKLADDSAYAPHAMQYLDVTDGITAPAAATGRARIYVDTADGDLKIIFADGTIKTIVVDT